jgi:Histidine kinase-, DNA gyrase B-, and HSP90-like ATPase
MALIKTAAGKDAALPQVEARLKRQIGEIVRAYRHSWDIYAELIQNSVDAINRRFNILNNPEFYLYESMRESGVDLKSDEGFFGRIELIVNIPDRTITIKDNGVGIPENKLEEFLLPEGSDKVVGKEYGFKGYGLTYVAFISDEFNMTSKHFLGNKKPFIYSELGLFSWLVDCEPLNDSNDIHETADDLENFNTIINVKVAKDFESRFPAITSADRRQCF